MDKHYIRKADILLIGGIVAFGCILGVIILLTRHEGNTVQVRVDGSVVESFLLTENRTYEINGVEDGTNRLVIKDGAAWVEEASCPDGLCINMGKISQNGQSIVCLPNKVVVEILDGDTSSSDSEIDIISR